VPNPFKDGHCGEFLLEDARRIKGFVFTRITGNPIELYLGKASNSGQQPFGVKEHE
jgi:hypothetical protein